MVFSKPTLYTEAYKKIRWQKPDDTKHRVETIQGISLPLKLNKAVPM